MTDPLITGLDDIQKPVYQDDVVKLKLAIELYKEEILQLTMLNEVLVLENSTLLGQTTIH